MLPISLNKISLPFNLTAYGKIALPGSKSISNRVLLLSALSTGTTRIKGLLDADDIARMKEALTQLGVSITKIDADTFDVLGVAGVFPNKHADIFLGNAGTAFRPLTAVLAISAGEYKLSGIARMHERPIKDLVEALQSIGCEIDYLENTGFPPLHLKGCTLNSNNIAVRGDVSSQFLTALLMALPLTKQAFSIDIIGELISKPYIAITLNLLKQFGINIINQNWKKFEIEANQDYQSPTMIEVEGDASSASYFLAMGALGGCVSVTGVDAHSIQGDVKFAEALAQMGAQITYDKHSISASIPKNAQKLTAIELDCVAIPDAAMTLAVLALFAVGTTKLTNIASWRVKETDRISAMNIELTKLGAIVVEGADFIEITAPDNLIPNIEINTYDDHRMAMCFSLVSFAVPVIILEPECVAKTYPDYFKDFMQLKKA